MTIVVGYSDVHDAKRAGAFQPSVAAMMAAFDAEKQKQNKKQTL